MLIILPARMSGATSYAPITFCLNSHVLNSRGKWFQVPSLLVAFQEKVPDTFDLAVAFQEKVPDTFDLARGFAISPRFSVMILPW